VGNVTFMRVLLQPNALLAILGLVAGVSGALAAGRLVQERANSVERALHARYQPRDVVVAARDLVAGQRIEADMLASRPMPGAFLPAGALPTNQAGTLLGRRIHVGLRRGDPVQNLNIDGRNVQALSDVIRSGGRAMTLSVDDTNSMAGLLQAGDVVDLFYSRNQGERSVLVPLLDRVEVLAAGDSLKGTNAGANGPMEGARGFATITVHVSAEDAARLVLAQATGTVTVLLRSRADEGHAVVETRNSGHLLTRSIGARPRTQVPRESVELIVGGTGSVVPEVSHLSIGSNQASDAGGRT